MICNKCLNDRLKKDKNKAMKNYTKELKKERHDTSKQTKRK